MEEINSNRHSTTHPVYIDHTPPQTAAPILQRPVLSREVQKGGYWLVPCFIAANTVVFVVTMYVNNCPKNSIHCIGKLLGRLAFQPFKENPLLGPSSSTLLKMGALEVSRIVETHRVWLLITCNWLHGGLFHLLPNMLSLLVIGVPLEQEFGFVRIGLLYIISGLGSSLMSALFIQSNISIGASGAIAGLLAGMVSELITNWTIYSDQVATLLTLFVIIAIDLALGILPHVDNFGHLGGSLSGFFLGFVILIRPHYSWITQKYTPPRIISASVRPKYRMYQRTLWMLALVVLITGFTLGFVMLIRGVDANNYCSWCRYLSCVPTSRWSCKTSPSYCITSQTGNQFNLTCSGSGKSRLYTLPGATGSQIKGLCAELCS